MPPESNKSQKCAHIAIIGAPNAGKSTLINRLAGGKISIVTPKAQTTRFNVRGVANIGETQLVFIDTPGIFDADRPFEKGMVKAATSALEDADILLVMIDAKRGADKAFNGIVKRIKGKRAMLAINKVDLVNKPTLFELAQKLNDMHPFEATFMISALKDDGLDYMLQKLADTAPEAEWTFPDEEMHTDITERQLAAEITRETLFLRLGDELPYSLHVDTELWEEKADGSVKINHVIMVERQGQKPIIIGKNGEMIKKVGEAARQHIEKALARPVHLFLYVKVQEDWKNKPQIFNALDDLG